MVIVTLIDPPQDVRHRQESTKAYINGQALDTGSLLIAESRLAWVMTSGMGFSIEYPAITMHAISRDLSSFPEESLCVILDNSHNPGVDGSGESGASATELRFTPEDPSALTLMFQTMSACQRLHPELDENDDEEDAEDENESDLDLMPEDDQVIFQCTIPAIQPAMYGQSDGAADVQHLEAAVGQLMTNGGAHNVDMEMMSENEDQFEDAECDH